MEAGRKNRVPLHSSQAFFYEIGLRWGCQAGRSGRRRPSLVSMHTSATRQPNRSTDFSAREPRQGAALAPALLAQRGLERQAKNLKKPKARWWLYKIENVAADR